MARSRKDGRRGGGHKSLNLKREDFENRFLKRSGTRKHRRTGKKFGFQEVEKHFEDARLAECFSGLEVLDYRFYLSMRRALRHSESPDALLTFLVDIAERSDLLEDNTYLQGLTALLRDKESWVRAPRTWRVETADRGEQFSELLRHLLAEYDVPRFMDRAWLDNNTRHQGWFKHIAGGKNIRTAAGLPFVLTKKMAHHFLRAPEHYTIAEALRWGQVYGLGGTSRLVEALRETYLIRALQRPAARENFWFVEDAFWVRVLFFFIAHPMLDGTVLPALVNYIRLQKYGDPQRGILPAHPNFSMRHRRPETLLNQMNAWHAANRAAANRDAAARPRRKPESHQWQRSGIGGFRLGTHRRSWRIRELRNTDELKKEGAALQHCVATYADSCQKRTKSIWTLENVAYDTNTNRSSRKKALTIAVDLPSKMISEVRGKANRLPTKEEHFILAKWAEQEGLSFPQM